jgi:hypothetical protein
MRHFIIPVIAVLALSSIALVAEESGPQSNPPTEASPPDEQPPAEGVAEEKRVLTPEELAEKEARKECKKRICDIIATLDPEGEDISCDIVKTWREEDITKMLGDQIGWPWGKAVCQSKLELKREPLAKAMSEASYAIVMPLQKARCTLAQKEGEPYVVEVSFTPKVTFKHGKAVEAALNWGEASAPLLIYPLVYAGTGFDNSTNVLGPQVVRMINEFTTKKCTEVRVELPSSKP